MLAPGAPHLVIHHLVIDGGAFVQLANGQSIQLGPGDVVVLPHGDAHQMTNSRGVTTTSLTSAILSKIKSRCLSTMQAGGSGDTARMFAATWLAILPESTDSERAAARL